MRLSDSKNKKHILRHVFPFSFSRYGVRASEVGNWWEVFASEESKFIKSSQYGDFPKGSNNELFPYIGQMVDFNCVFTVSKESYSRDRDFIGYHVASELNYNLNLVENRIKSHVLEPSPNNPFHLNRPQIQISIERYQIFAFKSNIGFLVLTYSIEGIDTVEELVEINAFLRITNQKLYTLKVNYFDEETIARKTFSPEHLKEVKMSISNLANKLLMNFQGIHFFGDHRLLKPGEAEECVSMPGKALVFVSDVIETEGHSDETSQVYMHLLRLSRGYDAKYLFNINRLDDYSLLHAFKDITWAMSYEGCACLGTPPSNNHSNFLTEGFQERVSQNYFYLYILLLHQYYGLINLNRLIATLPSDLSSYVNQERRFKDSAKENYQRLRSIQDKVYFFYLRCMFDEVSFITHQNEFYKKLKSVHNIDNVLKELDFELSKLSHLTTEIRREEGAKIEVAKKRRFNFLSTGGSALVILTTFDKLSSNIRNLIDRLPINHQWLHVEDNGLYNILLTGIVLTVIYGVSYMVDAIKERWF